MEQRKLTGYQIDILKEIIENSIEFISYNKSNRTVKNHKIQKQLEKITKSHTRSDNLDAFVSLEKDFHVLILNHKLKFGLLSRCGYKVDLDEAKRLYYSNVNLDNSN